MTEARSRLALLLALCATLAAALLAWAAQEAPGATHWAAADAAWMPGDALAAPADAAWQPVALPLRRPADPRGDPAAQGQWWYRLRVPAEAGPQALYVPRVSGAAVRVVMRAGQGQPWVTLWDGAGQRAAQWNRPVLVTLAQASTTRDVALVLTHEMDGGHRLASPRTGPLAPLHLRAQLRGFWQQTAPLAGSLAFVALGLMAWLHWVRRPGERAHLLFALTALATLVRNLHYHADMSEIDDRLYDWLWWLTNASLAWVMVLIYLFTLRFAHRRHPRVEALLAVFVVVATLMAMPIVLPDLTLTHLHLLNTAVAVVVTGWLLGLARDGSPELRAVTAALVLADLAGVHDLVLVSGGTVLLESVYLLPLSLFGVLLACLYAAQQRYTQALCAAEQANAGLAERLAAREAELRAGHERLRAVEREQTLLLERQRLMRDMHDGLGSTLISSLALAQRGRLDGAQVTVLLRDCVDDLRLVIDSLEPIGHDLVTLLAALRYRLGPRLEGAGLHIDWAVEDVPPLNWLGPPEALGLLRCVQEVLTNVLKHAGARTVRMAVARRGDEVCVDIEDDGVGFDPAVTPGGRGLRHLRERAAQWGGAVLVRSTPGRGTAVRLVLPLLRPAAAARARG